MEEKKITPEESMEIITQMIQVSQRRTSPGKLRISVMWAAVSIATAAVFAVMMYLTRDNRTAYIWFAIPAVGFPLNYLMCRKETRRTEPRTYIDQAIHTTWRALSLLSAALIAVCAAVHLLGYPGVWTAMLFFGFVGPGAGTLMQGILTREGTYVAGGWLSLLTGLALIGLGACHLLPGGYWLIAVWILCYALMFLVPAYAVYRKYKRTGR